MKTTFHNPRLYEHLKAATEVALYLLQDIKSGKIYPEGGDVNAMIANEPSFISCVHFLMEDRTIKRLRNIEEKPEEVREEVRKMIFRFIRKYLCCPFDKDNVGGVL